MAKSLIVKTGSIPLELTKLLTVKVQRAWTDGSLLAQVSPVTQELLRYWFSAALCANRDVNFHEGQRRAILNVIYCHEVLRARSLLERYQKLLASDANPPIAAEDLAVIAANNAVHPKYCIKMATGTGKTWVLNALLVWQYLNFKVGTAGSFTKNFLIVTPGLIIYDRMLDTLLGKERKNGKRDYKTADLKQHEELFLPPEYRETVQAFVQNRVIVKEELARGKLTMDGLIAVTNWHAFLERTAESAPQAEADDSELNTKQLVRELLPITPGKSAGHALDVLDNQLTRGAELAQLAALKTLCVFNDEAHHLHKQKTAGEEAEVQWQQALRHIAKHKGTNFIQCDFSATPYDAIGSGKQLVKDYFPHIVIDFSLEEAVQQHLVKLIMIDKRKVAASLRNDEINFRAIRERGRVVELSSGQRLMLRAGLKKLRILEEAFTSNKKYPKLLVVCEETGAAELVCKFFSAEGYSNDDILHIDSKSKSEMNEKQWGLVKQQLSDIDNRKRPKLIVSVLMLREGFDVNNICVIVPLRSSESPILLEQVIGRGLRLMWREPEYQDFKDASYQLVLEQHKEPLLNGKGCYDMLFIIEHPAYMKFYAELEAGLYGEQEVDLTVERARGKLLVVGLKPDYKQYDIYLPELEREREETLVSQHIAVSGLAALTGTNLSELQALLPKAHKEHFISEEQTVKTRFGEYHVTAELFNAANYNEYLQKLMRVVLDHFVSPTRHARKKKLFPLLQVREHELIGALDRYIRTRLFNDTFNPMAGNNWRILMLVRKNITTHIIREFYKVIETMQGTVAVEDAVVRKRYFSEQQTLNLNEDYALPLRKTIYTHTAYPANRGGLEKDFMEFLDTESEVISFVKVNEYHHHFAKLSYVRMDGIPASYYTDFIVRLEGYIYLVETKAETDLSNENVLRKRRSALQWLEKVNAVKPEQRMNAEWHYVILDDTTFYEQRADNASLRDILTHTELTNRSLEGVLFE